MVKLECYVESTKEWVHIATFGNEQSAWISLGSDHTAYRTVDESTGKVLTTKERK